MKVRVPALLFGLVIVVELSACSKKPPAIEEEAPCRYEPFDGICRVKNVRERPSPSGTQVIFTATFVADFAGGSHFEQEFTIPETGSKEFRAYLVKPSTMVVCAGEAITSGTCAVRTRGTARTLSLQSFEEGDAS